MKKALSLFLTLAMLLGCLALPAFAEEERNGYSLFVYFDGFLAEEDAEEAAAAKVAHEVSEEPFYVIPEIENAEVEGLNFLGYLCKEDKKMYKTGDSVPLDVFEEREDGYTLRLTAKYGEKEKPGVTYTDTERYDVSVHILSPDDVDFEHPIKTFRDSFDKLEGASVGWTGTIRQLTGYYRSFGDEGFVSLLSGKNFKTGEDFDVSALPEPEFAGIELEELNEKEGNRVSVYEVNEYLLPLFEYEGAVGGFLDPVIGCRIVYCVEMPSDEEGEDASPFFAIVKTEEFTAAMADLEVPIELDAGLPDYLTALGYVFDGWGDLSDDVITYPEGQVFLDEYSGSDGEGHLSFYIRMFYSLADEDETPEEQLAAAKEALSAKYREMLEDETASDGRKALAEAAIEEINNAPSREEIVNIARRYDDEFALQEKKDEAIEEAKGLAPEDADEEITRIVEEAIEAIQASENADGFEEILSDARSAINRVIDERVNFEDAKRETAEKIEELAEEDDSDEVRAIIEQAAEDAANAKDQDELSDVLLKARDDVKAQRLKEAKEEAEKEIRDEWDGDEAENVVKAAEDALDAIDGAEDTEAVNAAKEAGIEAIRTAKQANIPVEYTAAGDAEWTKGSKDGLTFTTDIPFEKFTSVKIDGAEVGAEAAEENGTAKITLAPALLETLTEGKHTVEFLAENGAATASILVKPVPPTTGDGALVCVLITLACIAGMTLAEKKKR